MRIGLVSTCQTTTPPQGYGAELATHELAQALEERGHDILLFAPEGSLAPPNGTLYEIPGPILAEGEKQLAEQIAAESTVYWRHGALLKSCDAVHDMSLYLRAHELLWLDGWRRSLYTLNGISYLSPFTKETRHNAVVVSQCALEYAKRGWSAWHGSPYDHGERAGTLPHAEVVKYGCNTDFYTPGPPRENFVLYVGRPHQAKGTPIIVKLAKCRPDLEFVLAWRAEFKDHIDQERAILAAAKDLPNVHFVGLPAERLAHHTAKRDLMATCGVFLHPAVYVDACPRGVIEAQACGAPVVAFQHGGTPEIVVPDETGVLPPLLPGWWEREPEILDSLSQAVNAAFKIDPAKVRAHALDNFTADRMAQDYENLYKRLVNKETW